MPNLLPIGKEEIKEDDGIVEGSTPDEEPPTPTNVQPPLPVEAADEVEGEREGSDDEGSSTDDQDATSDLETGSSSVPYEALNEMIVLPDVDIEDQEETAGVAVIDLGEAPGETADFDETPKPQLAVQEDFDLSPCSEATGNGPVAAAAASAPLVRSRSRDSVDSGKLGLTETELSDWADNSLAAELDVDSEPVKLAKPPPELPKSKPPPLSNGPQTQLDDIEFADDGEEVFSEEVVLEKAKPKLNEPVKPQVNSFTFK